MCDTVRSFTNKELFGSLTDYMYERTSDHWKYLEKQMAKFQRLDCITLFDMRTTIDNYRKGPNDNVFDIHIISKSAAISQVMSALSKNAIPTKFFKVDSYTYKMVYEDVSELVNFEIWHAIDGKVINIKMRGSTFFVTLI